MKLYKFVGANKNPDAELPPQAATIVKEVKAKEVIRRDELMGVLETDFSQRQYQQSADHVFAFYKKRLIDEGYMIELTV